MRNAGGFKLNSSLGCLITQITAVKPLISVDRGLLRVKSLSFFRIEGCVQYAVIVNGEHRLKKLMYSEIGRPSHRDEDLLPRLGDQRHE